MIGYYDNSGVVKKIIPGGGGDTFEILVPNRIVFVLVKINKHRLKKKEKKEDILVESITFHPLG